MTGLSKAVRRKAKCPCHGGALVMSRTQYGPRWACPVEGCTVVWWSNSKTSTPADQETRNARHAAHQAFDPLWQNGPYTRNAAYRKLADFMGKSARKTHIGMFDIAECERVHEFVRKELEPSE